MKILIVSDIHANWPALSAISESSDQVFFLGDAVNYGPHPTQCVEWVEGRATFAVTGNHDRAIAKNVDPHCSKPYAAAAAAVGAIHKEMLGERHKAFLAGLPLFERVSIHGTTFGLVHSSPDDPLYGYHSEAELLEVLPDLDVDVLLVGHTHLPCVRRAGKKMLINPGSVGQPKDGDPRACYAVWEDGEGSIRRAEYPVERTIQDLRAMDLTREVFELLAGTLQTGGRVEVVQEAR
jgi:putative phosphoesterase